MFSHRNSGQNWIYNYSENNIINMSKPNERWCPLLQDFSKNFCPPLWDRTTLKWRNFFSIGRLVPKKILVRQKYSVCLFSKTKFDFVCFPAFLPFFCKNCVIFAKKRWKWWETDKVEKFCEKWKVWDVKMSFHTLSAIKAQKFIFLRLVEVRS